VGDKTWPTRFGKMQARRAMQALPERVRPHYHPEYRIGLYADDPDGAFVGLVCNVCNQWREYGHDGTCRVRRYEPTYRWRPTLMKRIGRTRAIS
jgi:hypothetical protein